MKKLFVLFTLTFSLVVFAACGNANNEITELSFDVGNTLEDGGEPMESKLMVVPNYENSTLALAYSLTYTDRASDDPDNVKAEAEVGGEAFEMFQSVAEELKSYEDDSEIADFQVNVKMGATERNYQLSSEELADVHTLYDELVSMLTQNTF